jgi:hypothetical protein
MTRSIRLVSVIGAIAFALGCTTREQAAHTKAGPDHVLVCFVTAPDGRPHVPHGMITHIRIA